MKFHLWLSQATVLPLAPPVAVLLSKHPDVDLYDLSSAHTAFCASAPLSEDLSRQVTHRLKLKSFRQGPAKYQLELLRCSWIRTYPHLQSLYKAHNHIGAYYDHSLLFFVHFSYYFMNVAGYGMTECVINFVSPVVGWKHGSAGQVCVNTQAKVKNKHLLTSLVMPCPSSLNDIFCELMFQKVMDYTTGTALGPNQSGEIWMRGPTMMQGYFDRPQATKDTLTQDGWLKSGIDLYTVFSNNLIK